jgi:DNA-binding NarL/FixJ family response regulator
MRCYSEVVSLGVMQPEDFRTQIQALQQTITSLLEGWTLVVCSSHERIRDTTALLLPALHFTASSTAECLALGLPSEGQLLVLCDDDGADGGAVELIELMRERHGAERCRFLLCLDRDISAARLVRLWCLRPDAISCREHCGSGRLLQCVAVLLRNGRYEDPDLSDRLRQLLADVTADGEGVGLSLREERLVRMVACGRTSRQIGAQFDLRADSVRKLFCELYKKTGATGRGALMVWGLEHGVLKQQDLACQLRRPRPKGKAAGAGCSKRGRPRKQQIQPSETALR